MTTASDPATAAALAVDLKTAAKILCVSERTLWAWARRGAVPSVRIGRRRVFPVRALEEWLRSKTRGGDGRKAGT